MVINETQALVQAMGAGVAADYVKEGLQATQHLPTHHFQSEASGQGWSGS